MRTEHRDQARFCPFALREVSVLAELALGHLRYSLTDVPPQSNSPPGSVLETDHAGVQLANGRGRTPLLHAWLKNTVTAGIWIPGARVPPNRPTSHPTFIHFDHFCEILTSGTNSYVTLPLPEESHCFCHLSMATSLHLARRLRTPDPSSAIKSRSSRASPRLILHLVRLMRHCKSHGGEPAKTCIATQNHSLTSNELFSHVFSFESLAPGSRSIQSHRFKYSLNPRPRDPVLHAPTFTQDATKTTEPRRQLPSQFFHMRGEAKSLTNNTPK
ncbi:unnamed protein product [Trichogramma brassicae]|uniref:Uncharacterized protein n=1 Tax=Trichogramma brassicae TaxID=86971 RepID=A0A6H5I7Q8_9HYME|nr:unnamed protein product [Trichogramma brassicae]